MRPWRQERLSLGGAGLVGIALAMAGLVAGCDRAEESSMPVIEDDDEEDDRRPKRSKTPARRADAARIRQVVHGERHACSLFDDGTVSCWGRNLEGQLGGPTPPWRRTPATAPGVAKMTMLAANAFYTCGLDEAHEVSCWGERSWAEGRSDRGLVREPELDHAVSIAAGNRHVCVAREDGTVFCVGTNRRGQLGAGQPADARSGVVKGVSAVVEVAAGNDHTCARDLGGTVKCWGSNLMRAIGDGAKDDRDTATTVSLPLAAKRIAAGDHSSCAVLDDGTVACWGLAMKGMIGPDDGGRPRRVDALSDAEQVAVGDRFACARQSQGAVMCWGRTDDGRLGRESDAMPGKAAVIPTIRSAVSVAAAPRIGCAVVDGGVELRCWGSAEFGRIGDGSSSHVPSPVTVPKIDDAVSLALGRGYSCALRRSGAVACWGDGNHLTGEMKTGFRLRANIPKNVPGLTDIDRLFGDERDVVAVKKDGGAFIVRGGIVRDPSSFLVKRFVPEPVKGAGDIAMLVAHSARRFALLDDHSVVRIRGRDLERTPLEGVTDVVAMAASLRELCFVRKNGTVGCAEIGRQRGAKTTAALDIVELTGVTDAVDVAVSFSAGCIVHRGGGVSCWSTTGRKGKTLLPVAGVTGATKVITSAQSARVACALLTTGAVQCWSTYGNHEGQLGTGQFDKRQIPAPVTGIRDAIDIEATPDHVCALHRNGKVSCWGDNRFDQVGAPSPPALWSPARVRFDDGDKDPG